VGAKVDRSTLLTKYGAYVRSLANQVRRQFHCRLDIEDLVAYGNVGLFEAADRYDCAVGSNFLTFAHYRIKGAIFDGLRKMGTLRGSDHRAAYLGERANAYLDNASAREAAMRRSFADAVHEVETAVRSLAAIFAAGSDALDRLEIRDDNLSPEERMELSQLQARVRAAVNGLPENERKLLIAYYYEGKTLEEAGASIGQSKSWASRLHARAIERIKDFLAEEGATPGRLPPGRSTGSMMAVRHLSQEAARATTGSMKAAGRPVTGGFAALGEDSYEATEKTAREAHPAGARGGRPVAKPGRPG
jgi:RNA polymerase sigma factor for flagellar operon FliA